MQLLEHVENTRAMFRSNADAIVDEHQFHDTPPHYRCDASLWLYVLRQKLQCISDEIANDLAQHRAFCHYRWERILNDNAGVPSFYLGRRRTDQL